MEFHRPLCLFFVLLSLLLSSSEAYKFNVGESAGWTPNPSENYNQWSGRNRFNVNDTIVFKYKKGSDSVLEVKKEDYDKCNKTNPIKKFEEGDTEFKLDRPGPFYFISGKDENCEKGQKLIVLVITPRKQTPPSVPTPTSPPKPSPTPSPKPNPPSGSPPAMPPTSVSPSPASSPVPAGRPPASSPTPAATSPSPSPVSTPPAGGPPTTSPATSPTPSPISTPPAGGPPTTSPAPAATSPTPSPTSTPPAGGPPTTPPSPGATPPSTSPPGISPTGGPPAPGTPPPSSSNQTAPPQGNSGSSVTPSSFLVYSVTVVVGAAFLRY